MARFAAYAGAQALQVQPALADSAGRMAPETVAGSDRVHLASGRLFDALGPATHGAHRQIQRSQSVIEADAAFVEVAVMLEDVGLTGLSPAKGPPQRDS